MNQDELKDKKSDRSLSTRKILVSSQVPPSQFFFYLVVAVIVLATFSWTYFGISSQQDNLVKINNRLITLEENVQSTSDSSEENIETLLADLKIINREIRKLWDLSNKRNKKNISLLETRVNEITEATNTNNQNFDDIKNRMENINDSISEVQSRLAKLSSLELSTGIYDQKFKELFEAIDSIDAYRIQINQRLLDIDKELNSFDLNSSKE